MRLLDLFCGAGGCSTGYSRAGFEVVGVDHEPMPRYPFAFFEADALDFLRGILAGATVLGWRLNDFDAIHASPPCQRYSDLASRNRNANDHPDLVGPTRALLEASGKPWVIENVDGAPLVNPILLCGTMFKGLRVIRHRLFESNVFLMAPQCRRHPLTFTHDKRKQHHGRINQNEAFVQVNGGGNCSVANARSAMGIDWMTKTELNQAIPPAYCDWIGRQLLSHLEANR